jgi:hypothetical protein
MTLINEQHTERPPTDRATVAKIINPFKNGKCPPAQRQAEEFQLQGIKIEKIYWVRFDTAQRSRQGGSMRRRMSASDLS